jgi:maleate cis-trans isomerase
LEQSVVQLARDTRTLATPLFPTKTQLSVQLLVIGAMEQSLSSPVVSETASRIHTALVAIALEDRSEL